MKKQFIFYYFFIIILLFIFLNVFSNSKVEKLMDEKYLNIATQIQQETQTLLEQKQETTLILALALSKDTLVQNALIKNDYTLLSLEDISKMYATDSSLKHVWLHIVKSDGISFMKSWSKQKGESILGFRKDVVKFLKNPKITQTISVGKFDITIKAQVPIYKDKQFLGIFEVITKLNSIANKLEKDNSVPIILADKSYKKQLKFPFTKMFIEDYYVANLDADKKIVALLKKHNIEEIIKTTKNYRFIENYFLTIYHLNNTHNKNLGYIFLFKDLNKIDLSEINTTSRDFIFKWMSIIIVIVLLFFILLNREYTKKLKNDVLSKTHENMKQMEVIQQQDKLASMGEMIGNIAHQWRQPLSIISTSATGMKFQKKYGQLTDEDFDTTCELINTNAQYLSKTIDDFRNFIKNEHNKTTFMLQNEINSFLHLIEGSTKNHNIKVILDFQKDILITGYEHALTQSFINIFNNSKDAFQEKKIQDRYIFMSTSVKNNNAIITIKDNGGGIPLDVLPKIFEPYFTTKHQGQGTGLGLHMTYKLIVEGMDGTIKASNVKYRYNKTNYTGSEFVITLPLATNNN